ncbi:hypothetical protein ABIA24_005315 [Sinorhizobium fredii]
MFLRQHHREDDAHGGEVQHAPLTPGLLGLEQHELARVVEVFHEEFADALEGSSAAFAAGF